LPVSGLRGRKGCGPIRADTLMVAQDGLIEDLAFANGSG
jgi:hypothetical protein